MNAIDALAAAAERDGETPLPLLTQADLCALGAAGKTLVCARTWTWWTGLSSTEREALAAKSLEVLVLRGLITPASGKAPAVPVPELGLILGARANARLVVTCQVPGEDTAFEPRFFGITQQDAGLRAVVRETLTPDAPGPGGQADLGTILRYTLMTPAHAATTMTAWARGKGTATQLDVYGHGADGRISLDRFEIRPAGTLFDVYRPAGGIPPGRFDHMELRQMLTSALAGAAR